MPVTLPSVSVQLPCGYGDKYVATAIDCFLAQDYPDLELVLLDNNETPIRHLFPYDPRIKYARTQRAPVGRLRNQANALATGDIIVHFDEDDFSGSNRVSFQVDRLLSSGKSVTGFHSALYYDIDTERTYKYFYEPNPAAKHPAYAFGSSQCYLKSYWALHPFVESGVEDWPFSFEALSLNELDSCDAGKHLVCRSHKNSACYPHFSGPQFPEVERTALPQEFFRSIGAESCSAQKVGC